MNFEEFEKIFNDWGALSPDHLSKKGPTIGSPSLTEFSRQTGIPLTTLQDWKSGIGSIRKNSRNERLLITFAKSVEKGKLKK